MSGRIRILHGMHSGVDARVFESCNEEYRKVLNNNLILAMSISNVYFKGPSE